MIKNTQAKSSENNSTPGEKKTTPRISIKQHFPSLSDKEIEAIELSQEMLDEMLQKIKREGGFTNQDICDLLNPCIKNANVVSRIGTDTDKTDNRHVNLKLAVAMRRVFGISLDEIIDDCFEYLPTREFPQKALKSNVAKSGSDDNF